MSPGVRCPPLGKAIPDIPHAISVSLPTWQNVVDFAEYKPSVRASIEGGYPRLYLDRRVRYLIDITMQVCDKMVRTCLLFAAKSYAEDCKSYLHGHGVEQSELYIRALKFKRSPSDSWCLSLYGVFMEQKSFRRAMHFWRHTGLCLSTRLAEDLLPNAMSVVPASGQRAGSADAKRIRSSEGLKAVETVRNRIATLLERAPIGGPRTPATTAQDVFLHPTGMAAIYHVIRTLRHWSGTGAVVFGTPYDSTLRLQEEFAKAVTLYPGGTGAELDDLEALLAAESREGRMVQSLWCECPSNPLCRAPDLDRVRRLADHFGFVVVVDETVGSFANVDVMAAADVVVTSLTKSFSGMADVMAGSAVVNPRSHWAARLRGELAKGFEDTLYDGDAIKLELNSRGFLGRAAKINSNAARLVSLLAPLADAEHPSKPLSRVYYPSTEPESKANYEARMRPATPEFTPGYGGLFTLEFASIDTARAFFDALQVAKGPSLGAAVTLAQPFVEAVFAQRKDLAASYGLSESIVRVSVGIEPIEELESAFLRAMEVAEKVHGAKIKAVA
jgi:cystathionine gamma-synthase